MVTGVASAVASRRGGFLTPPTSFVAIDFETANPSRASVIQIGLVRVIDGVIGRTHTSPVMPPAGHRAFAPGNVKVHGLGPGYILHAPEWPNIMERLVRLATVGECVLPLVAHNAAFERSVITRASEAVGVASPWTPEDYFCTVKYARRVLPHLPQHKLNVLVEHLELGEFSHHDAGEDAAMTAKLLLALAAIE